MSIHTSRQERARWRADRRRFMQALFLMQGQPALVSNTTAADAELIADLEVHGAIRITLEADLVPEMGKLYARLGPNAALYMLALDILSKADNRESITGGVTLELRGQDVQALELTVYGRPQA